MFQCSKSPVNDGCWLLSIISNKNLNRMPSLFLFFFQGIATWEIWLYKKWSYGFVCKHYHRHLIASALYVCLTHRENFEIKKNESNIFIKSTTYLTLRIQQQYFFFFRNRRIWNMAFGFCSNFSCLHFVNVMPFSHS